MSIGIYEIKNSKNGKTYIGSSKNIEKRFKRHLNELSKNKHHNIHLQRAWNMYGSSVFIFDIIEICKIEELKIKEQIFLDDIFETNNHNDNYYNIGKKSCGGDNISNNPNRDNIIINMTNANKRRYDNMSVSERKDYGYKMSGVNNPNYGNRWSDELREHLSKIKKEYFKNNDNYIKNSTFDEYYGKEKSDELKLNLSICAKKRIGIKNPFFGKSHSDESKKIISEINKGFKVFSTLKPFTIDDVVFLSLTDASIELKIHITTIRHRLISKNIKYNNYQYITDHNIFRRFEK